jgi:hypothetical protein
VNAPDEFDRIVAPQFPQESIDPQPYGARPANTKAGLTPRGKVALALSAAAIATSGLVGYQAYSADAAESAAKSQEIAYKKDLLELEKLKLQSQVNKTKASTVSVRQKQIDACVANSKDLVGKSLDSSYRDIVEACQAQYTSGDDLNLQTAAASSDHSGGINNGVFLAGGLGVIGLIYLVQRGRRSNAT